MRKTQQKVNFLASRKGIWEKKIGKRADSERHSTRVQLFEILQYRTYREWGLTTYSACNVQCNAVQCVRLFMTLLLLLLPGLC